MPKRILFAAMAAIAGFTAACAPLQAQTLDKIKQRGVLVVGTKADYKPFGFRDPSGAIVGFEPDLAKDVADRLGVRLEMCIRDRCASRSAALMIWPDWQ